MESPIIRKATYFELDAIADIYKCQIGEIRAFKRALVDYYRKPRFKIYSLIVDGKVAGFCTVEPINGLEPRKFIEGVKTVWVHFIAVKHLGTGHGKLLMEHIEKLSKDAGNINGIGLHSNIRSHSFYEKLGFTIKSKVRHGHLPKLYMYKTI